MEVQKKVVPLQPQMRNKLSRLQRTLGYGVMVTLQILVLSFLVRIRVSQLTFHLPVGYGVMVTLQILVLSFLVRIRVSQPRRSIFHLVRDAFFIPLCSIFMLKTASKMDNKQIFSKKCKKNLVERNKNITFATAFEKKALGWLPEWPNGADCKSAGYAFGGSNPSPPTFP